MIWIIIIIIVGSLLHYLTQWKIVKEIRKLEYCVKVLGDALENIEFNTDR